jgi:hypothetical protein
MSTQAVDALEFTMRIQDLIRETVDDSSLTDCERRAKLSAYSEVLQLVVETCHVVV